jgi:ubiquinone/menaquinone biosynthesis C-methylase UbiE
MAQAERMYVPAAGRDWALPLYDPLVRLLGGHAARRLLIEQAELRRGHRVLEIGCGTGSLLVAIKRHQPAVDVVGLDPDPKALDRARRKALQGGVSIRLDRGYSDELPYDDGSFDRVLSSFMFHHLDADVKERTLREVRRVLAPDGRFHMLDFAGAEARSAGPVARLLHSSHRLHDNDEPHVIDLLRRAGFEDLETVRTGAMFLGLIRVKYYRASSGV